MRDIFWNGEIDDLMTANHFNGLLTNGVSFEERDKNFQYANILYDYESDYTKKLYDWLSRLTGYKLSSKPNGWKDSMFEFREVEQDEIDMSEYMKYDDWWVQLQDLIKKLEEQLKYLNKLEAEDSDRQEKIEEDFCYCGC